MPVVFDRRAKTAPSPYPRLFFHAFRISQFLSSLIVGSIMCYFIWHLTHDGLGIPWTFVWLTTASLFSILATSVTIGLHCCVGPSPRWSLVFNGSLAVLWALSWSMLTWFMSGTLANMCDIEHWSEDAGIMVCRLYKTLFTFTLTGLVSTIAALILDMLVVCKQSKRGIYRLHDLTDGKRRQASGEDPFADNQDQHMGAPRESGEFEAPRSSMAIYNEPGDLHIHHNGYAIPESQFNYDTGYHGRSSH